VAISPGIPTSFVPKLPVQAPKRRMSFANNLFLLVSLGIGGLAILAAVLVLAYAQFLMHIEDTKAAELQKEQESVSAETVKEYVRLKDRFNSGQQLLSNHITLSRFFDELEVLTLQNVQFNSLRLSVAGDGAAKIELDGAAKNFNALAVQSNAVASDKKIKRAIFSGIRFDSNTEKSSRILFKLTADLEPDLVHGATPTPAAVPAAPVVPSATTTTP